MRITVVPPEPVAPEVRVELNLDEFMYVLGMLGATYAGGWDSLAYANMMMIARDQGIFDEDDRIAGVDYMRHPAYCKGRLDIKRVEGSATSDG